MSEWVGETGDAPSLGDRFVRKYVILLTSEGGCKSDVAYNVVHDLLAELGELLTRAAEQVQQGEHQKP